MKSILLIGLTIYLLTSCDSSNIENKEKSLLEKENSLLRRENELMKREQEVKSEAFKEDINYLEISSENINTKIDPSLSFLLSFEGKYPREVNLLTHPKLKSRLQKILGNRYNFLLEIWDLQTPIEIENNFLSSKGMQAHSGGDPGGELLIDLVENKIYVKIKENDSTHLFDDDKNIIPTKIQNWLNN